MIFVIAVLIHFVCASVPTADDKLTEEFVFTVSPPVVLLHPVAVSVNVNVAEPAPTEVISPLLSTVATAGLLLTQIPPVVGDKVDVWPKQTVTGPVKLTAGASTVTVIAELALTQPVTLFLTVSIPLYTFAVAAAGITNAILLPGKAAFVTLAKPAEIAVASYTILYWLGEFVVL